MGSTTAGGQLRRILGVGFGLAVIIGSTLGIGILRSPGGVAAALHDRRAILAAWIVGGLYTLLGANCLTELGTMAPQAGGYYVYARRAFGDWVGFAVGWTDWVTYCAVLGYVSIGMSDLIAQIAPGLAGANTLIAIAMIVGFVALQWAGVRISGWFQEWTTALKFLAYLALIAAGLVLSGRAAAPAGSAALPPVSLATVAAAIQLIVVTYAGWQSGLYFTEEDRDPVRNLPRAMIGGVLAVAAVYLLVNVALLAILPVSVLAGSKLPASDAARLLIGDRASQVITVFQLISLPPLLNAIMMIGTRILFALGRDRLFWSRTMTVNARGNPSVATLVTTVVAVVLIALGTFERLVAIAAIFLLCNHLICCLALVVLRRREPGQPRPYRAWGYPWTAAIAIAGALAFLVVGVIGDPGSVFGALCVVVAGLAGLAWSRRRGPAVPP
jgi:APA family basic amino acid/polyamine antiporter